MEVLFDGQLTSASYGELLRRGYRRFGWQVFRPACQQCQACISLRVPVRDYQLSASDRRVMRKNEHIHCVLAPSLATGQHVDLFNRYQAFMHAERAWALQRHTVSSYREAFVLGPEQIGFEWRYFDGDRLVGVSLMDVVPGAISLVYFFYDPAWRRQSPGRFSILNQILFAKAHGLEYAYLGYWVKDCGSLNYKSRFRPHEALQQYVSEGEEPVWLERREP